MNSRYGANLATLVAETSRFSSAEYFQWLAENPSTQAKLSFVKIGARYSRECEDLLWFVLANLSDLSLL